MQTYFTALWRESRSKKGQYLGFIRTNKIIIVQYELYILPFHQSSPSNLLILATKSSTPPVRS